MTVKGDEELVTLSMTGGAPWGFRLLGGDVAPLQVAKVRKKSKADNAGVQEGDVLVVVNGRSVEGMSHTDAMEIVDGGGETLDVKVQRGGELPATEEVKVDTEDKTVAEPEPAPDKVVKDVTLEEAPPQILCPPPPPKPEPAATEQVVPPAEPKFETATVKIAVLESAPEMKTTHSSVTRTVTTESKSDNTGTKESIREVVTENKDGVSSTTTVRKERTSNGPLLIDDTLSKLESFPKTPEHLLQEKIDKKALFTPAKDIFSEKQTKSDFPPIEFVTAELRDDFKENVAPADSVMRDHQGIPIFNVRKIEVKAQTWDHNVPNMTQKQVPPPRQVPPPKHSKPQHSLPTAVKATGGRFEQTRPMVAPKPMKIQKQGGGNTGHPLPRQQHLPVFGPPVQISLAQSRPRDVQFDTADGYYDYPSPDYSQHLQNTEGRGARMFDRRKQKSDTWVIDESNVRKPKPPVVRFGTAPPSKLDRIQQNLQRAQMSPWEAAMHNPHGTVDAAFNHIGAYENAKAFNSTVPQQPMPPLYPVSKQSSLRSDTQLGLMQGPNFNRSAKGWNTTSDDYTLQQLGITPDVVYAQQHQQEQMPTVRQQQYRDHNPKPKAWRSQTLERSSHHQHQDNYATNPQGQYGGTWPRRQGQDQFSNLAAPAHAHHGRMSPQQPLYSNVSDL